LLDESATELDSKPSLDDEFETADEDREPLLLELLLLDLFDILSEDVSRLSLREFAELCSSAYMLTVLSAESIPESIRISPLWTLAKPPPPRKYFPFSFNAALQFYLL
jgi:hypothetical protein